MPSQENVFFKAKKIFNSQLSSAFIFLPPYILLYMGERKQENKAVYESKNPTPFHAEIGPKNFLSDQSIFTPISESIFTPLFNTNQTRTKHEPNTNRIRTGYEPTSGTLHYLPVESTAAPVVSRRDTTSVTPHTWGVRLKGANSTITCVGDHAVRYMSIVSRRDTTL